MFKKAFRRVKKFIQGNPIITGLTLMLSLHYISKALSTKIPNVKLSYFLLALNQNLISEVIITGTDLIFRGINSTTYNMKKFLILY